MFTDAGLEPDPMLVGPNWIFRSSEAPLTLANLAAQSR